MSESAPVMEVSGLGVRYRGTDHDAVTGIDFTVAEGETVALVGESGSGKSTIARAVLGLIDGVRGSIRFDGRELAGLSSARRRALRPSLQAVFQDPYSALNPARTVGASLAETLRPDRVAAPEASRRVRAILEQVGMSADAADRFPGSFSGGQRQRIAIARALMPRPRLIVCDEPVSALDLSVQAQVLNTLTDMKREFGVAYLFISHDLPVVRHFAERTVVLYHGRVVESGETERVFSSPEHAYTRSLLQNVPWS